MAEAVKNNGRKRRPPSHLREGYNQDNYEPIGNIYGTRGDQYKQNTDPCPMPVMARLLAKFLNSANKKLNQAKLKMAQQEMTPPPKKPTVQQSKFQSKSDKSVKDEKQTPSSKIQDNITIRQTGNGPESSRYQQRGSLQATNLSRSPPANAIRQIKNPPSSGDPSVKNPFSGDNPPNLESMSKMSRQQFLKLMPKGYDEKLYKQQLIFSSDPNTLKMMGKIPQNLIRQGARTNQFRQDTKLFKRASFHVGIAYNIHIQNIRQKNAHFGPQELDPTYVSRKLKMENTEFLKKQHEQNQKSRIWQEMIHKQRQQQALEEAKIRQRQSEQVNKQSNSPKDIQNANKQPICIDIDQENDQKQSKKSLNQEKDGNVEIKQQQAAQSQQEQMKPESQQQKSKMVNETGNQQQLKQEIPQTDINRVENEQKMAVEKHGMQQQKPQQNSLPAA